MNAYEKIIMTMRNESVKIKDSNPFFVGSVGSDGSVSVGEFLLDSDDYVLAAGLSLVEGDSVFVIRFNSDSFAVICKLV